MANVFYAWEFGANLGHIGTFLPVAKALRAKGHRIHWAVTHAHQAARLLPQEGFTWLQAPNLMERHRPGPPINYADILLRFGYAETLDLLGLTVAWRELLKLTGASILLADHAPTAILAARTCGIPVMLFGGSFFAPPRTHPTPNMRPWQPVPPTHLQQIDHLALTSINSVLSRFGHVTLDTVASLFQVEEQALLTFPELDHYENRGPATYWGALPSVVAAPPRWPMAHRPRVFAYLRPESAHFEAGLQALHALGGCILVFAPGITPAQRLRFATSSLQFLDTPVDLGQAARDADAAVTYASGVTTLAFLLAGKPVLLLPGQLEQFLLARRVEQMGAGLLIDPEKPADDLPQKLQRVVFDPLFAGNAQAFARKYAAFPQEVVIDNLVRRIEELCP